MSIIKKCKKCNIEFESYPSDNRKFCSRMCSDKGRDNRGLRGDAWYKAMSHVDMGHNRGKKMPKISKANKGQVPWNKGLTNCQPKLYGKDHPATKKRMELLGLSWDEYNNWKYSKKRYYAEVWRITNQQPLESLNNSDKLRGRAGTTGAYQLDHIIPISEGFSKGINPLIIGDIKNLRFTTWEHNLKRRYE